MLNIQRQDMLRKGYCYIIVYIQVLGDLSNLDYSFYYFLNWKVEIDYF